MKHRFRFVMGKHCIQELLQAAPERIVEVYTSQDTSQDSLCREIRHRRIPLRRLSKGELAALVHSDSHQSFVASVKEGAHRGVQPFIREMADKEKSLVVMLDSINDPQNLGAILRASECFGVDAVIYSKNRGVDITPVVSKVSSGATELVEIIKVSNLADTLRSFRENGYSGVCAEGGEDSISLYDFTFPSHSLLILGSEGKGIQKILHKNSDFHVQIPMMGKIDSLNVSQATAVFLSWYRARSSLQ